MAKKELKKTLGLWDVLMFGVGGIVDAGIYAIIGKATGFGENMLWLSFVIAAILALLTGLSYSEFVNRFPDAAGTFEYETGDVPIYAILAIALLAVGFRLIGNSKIVPSISNIFIFIFFGMSTSF